MYKVEKSTAEDMTDLEQNSCQLWPPLFLLPQPSTLVLASAVFNFSQHPFTASKRMEQAHVLNSFHGLQNITFVNMGMFNNYL